MLEAECSIDIIGSNGIFWAAYVLAALWPFNLLCRLAQNKHNACVCGVTLGGIPLIGMHRGFSLGRGIESDRIVTK